MLIIALIVAYLIYLMCRNAVENHIDSLENKYLNSTNLAERKNSILKTIDKEFPQGAPNQTQQCEELFRLAFTLIPRLNRYTALRIIKTRYVH